MAASADSSGVTKSKKPVTRAVATQFRATLARHQLANVFDNDENDSTQVASGSQEKRESEASEDDASPDGNARSEEKLNASRTG